MELIDGKGYRDSDIRRELGEERYKEFDEWLRGCTCPLSSTGEHLVYPWDYRRFLAGLPVVD